MMQSLLTKLRHDFPKVKFVAGRTFSWSGRTHTITYRRSSVRDPKLEAWSLLHELGHAVLDHQTYQSDFELLHMESAAWQEARQLAKRYSHPIDYEHIQDCLDTYRDWLHKRSTCPICGVHSFQQNATTYQCFNCQSSWRVSLARLCRPYRRLAADSKPVS